MKTLSDKIKPIIPLALLVVMAISTVGWLLSPYAPQKKAKRIADKTLASNSQVVLHLQEKMPDPHNLMSAYEGSRGIVNYEGLQESSQNLYDFAEYNFSLAQRYQEDGKFDLSTSHMITAQRIMDLLTSPQR